MQSAVYNEYSVSEIAKLSFDNFTEARNVPSY
jgi:hypothetical protein